MKKLICLLALCLCAMLCLNGVAAMAEAQEAAVGDAPAQAADPPAQAEEAPVEAEPEPEPEAEPDAETEATAEPTEEPTAETMEEPTPEPTEEPTPEPTAEETPEPTEAPTAEPTEEATPEPTEAPTVEPEATPTSSPALPEDAEAWFKRDGVKVGGALQDVLEVLDGAKKVYIRVDKTIYLEKAPLKRLSKLKLLPDGDVFPDDCEIRLSFEDPDAGYSVALIDPKTLSDRDADERAGVYVWVQDPHEVKKTRPRSESEQETDPGAAEQKLTVDAVGYVDSEWTREIPIFNLSGIPEGSAWSYAAIILDERIVPLSTDYYVPVEGGSFRLRFAMLNEMGDIEDISDNYNVMIDYTAPETVDIEMDEELNYTMYIAAEDSQSGVCALSLDGGKSWMELYNDEVYTYKGTKKETFGIGDIVIRDFAGNNFINLEEYVVDKVSSGGGGGGGGGGGSGKAARTHASGEGEEGAKYDAVSLELPEEPMKKLTVGGEELDLTLWLESAEASGAPVGSMRAFTGELRRWGAADAGDSPDTLLLTAVEDVDLGEQYAYQWRFNGEVYRTLANSGISYVALKVGDNIAAFSTDGFTGGTKYTELKMLGVSTRRFSYALTMKVNKNAGYVSTMSDLDFSQPCDLSIRADVENMAYELNSSPNSIMYFYDVYLGPEEMLEKPFGEYKA